MTAAILSPTGSSRRHLTRTRAALVHLGISVVLGICAMALLFGVWYPPPYFSAAGADRLALLLIGVDVGIGPLLTFIVFKPGKKGLKFDLFVIAALQLGALVYGLHAVAVSRPVFLVFAVDRFELVAANQIADADLKQGKEERFRQRSWKGPLLVYGEMPTDPKEHGDLAFSGAEGRDLQNLPKYFRDYDANAMKVAEHANDLATLRSRLDADSVALLESWLQNHSLSDADVRWVPVVALRKDATILVARSTGKVLDTLPIEPPW
jgi:hypothetical protein